ncbi:TIGR04076 family protein [Clostridium tyrobutyricum]|uniref:TIGR04076 family protein n=2 Tax=Clostridium tyrobutyricum TaxID=1519 RepID=UPI001C37F70D|nr:TIGR04076 family protein [Clostridium tyrobutyricum]MBV4418030.1 TIGR04076 family protein [Clostridium tyrobutyricum]MBV4428924.1 TIGR04076 family protein [Clostridium tyrobutyricum]MBV4444792.1 TIGR04076 family protein [Clostridium tyrobutyricum]
MEKVIINVIGSKCDCYKKGDKIYIEDMLINMKRTSNVCVMALQAIFPFVYASRKGVTPEQMGYGEKLIVQCPDYQETVIFEVEKVDC